MHIEEIRALDAEVIGLSTRGDGEDVRRTHALLKLTYPLVPMPLAQVIQDFGLSTDQWGTSYATVIIDKLGIVRFVHDSTNANYRIAVSIILHRLQGSKDRV